MQRQRDVVIPRFTVQHMPEVLVHGSMPFSAFSDLSGTARDSKVVVGLLDSRGFKDFMSDTIRERVELVPRMGSAAAFFCDSTEQQTYVYWLLAHTSPSGAISAAHYNLSAADLLNPFTDRLQLPNASNKHVRLFPDTCFGENYHVPLGAVRDIVLQKHSSVVLQTSSTSSVAYGNMFVVVWSALQDELLRSVLLHAYRVCRHEQRPVTQLLPQMPALYSVGVQWLNEDAEVKQDPQTRLWFINNPWFFHFSLSCLVLPHPAAARTWRPDLTRLLSLHMEYVQVLACRTKTNQNGDRLAFFALYIAPINTYISAHVHCTRERMHWINLQQAQLSNPSGDCKTYVMDDDMSDPGRLRLGPHRPLFPRMQNVLMLFVKTHVWWWSSSHWPQRVAYAPQRSYSVFPRTALLAPNQVMALIANSTAI